MLDTKRKQSFADLCKLDKRSPGDVKTTHAKHRTNTTLLGNGCTDVRREAKYVPVYDADDAALSPQLIITNPCIYFGAPGPLQLWELASADLLRPMAIGHPIT
jgi:hypothetical protein